MVMMKDEALVVSSFFFFVGKRGAKIAPLKNFQKNFFGSGYGVVLNGWGVLVIRGGWNEVKGRGFVVGVVLGVI